MLFFLIYTTFFATFKYLIRIFNIYFQARTGFRIRPVAGKEALNILSIDNSTYYPSLAPSLAPSLPCSLPLSLAPSLARSLALSLSVCLSVCLPASLPIFFFLCLYTISTSLLLFEFFIRASNLKRFSQCTCFPSFLLNTVHQVVLTFALLHFSPSAHMCRFYF